MFRPGQTHVTWSFERLPRLIDPRNLYQPNVMGHTDAATHKSGARSMRSPANTSAECTVRNVQLQWHALYEHWNPKSEPTVFQLPTYWTALEVLQIGWAPRQSMRNLCELPGLQRSSCFGGNQRETKSSKPQFYYKNVTLKSRWSPCRRQKNLVTVIWILAVHSTC